MTILKRYVILLINFFSALVLSIALIGCQAKNTDNNVLTVGTIAGPETRLMEVAKEVAAKQLGLDIKIIEFSDYTLPNTALNDGSLDANMFQHQPYLDQTIKDRHYDLVAIGKTFIYPMGIYSKQIKNLSQLADNASVAIPNDPSNEARALLLLAKAKLITLKPDVSVQATILDIVKNPKHLQFKELDAAQLPRVLQDVTLAVINTNYAIPAGLMPTKDALLIEDANSPYANIVVVRTTTKNDPRFQQLLKALHSQAVLNEAKQLFQGQAIAAWKE